MDRKTLKLRLEDLVKHAREVAEEIKQAPPSNAVTWSMAQDHDKKLRDIETQLRGVVAAIDSYNSASI
jgi:hypothetical protein